MASRAALQKRMDELAAAVGRLVRRRGLALPDPDELGGFLVACLGYDEAERVARAIDAAGGDFTLMVEAVGALPVAPDSEALRGAVCDALAAVVGQEARGYKRTLERIVGLLPGKVVVGEALLRGGAALRPETQIAGEIVRYLGVDGDQEAGVRRAVLEELSRPPEPEPAVPRAEAAELVEEPSAESEGLPESASVGAVAAVPAVVAVESPVETQPDSPAEPPEPRRVPGEDGVVPGARRKVSHEGWTDWSPWTWREV